MRRVVKTVTSRPRPRRYLDYRSRGSVVEVRAAWRETQVRLTVSPTNNAPPVELLWGKTGSSRRVAQICATLPFR